MAMAQGIVPVPIEELDEILHRLFAIALRLCSLQVSSVDESVAQELQRLELEVDGLIREVRSRASVSPW